LTETGHRAQQHEADGFTLMELLVTMTIVSMLFAVIVPNLGAFVPTTRLEGSGNQIKAKIQWARSEAQIRGQPLAIELDLENSRWQIIHPPAQRLTLDQDLETLEEWSFGWNELEQGVVFLGAGDAIHGIARKGKYRIRFDEYGFSNDQMVILTLANEPDRIWSVTLRGLTGATTTAMTNDGKEPELTALGEGAF